MRSMIPFDSVGSKESLDSVTLKLLVNRVGLTLSFDIVDSKIWVGSREKSEWLVSFSISAGFVAYAHLTLSTIPKS